MIKLSPIDKYKQDLARDDFLFDAAQENAVKHLKPEMAIGFVVNKTEQVNLEGGGYGYYYAGAN